MNPNIDEALILLIKESNSMIGIFYIPQTLDLSDVDDDYEVNTRRVLIISCCSPNYDAVENQYQNSTNTKFHSNLIFFIQCNDNVLCQIGTGYGFDNKIQSHATVHLRLTDIFVNKTMLPLNDVTL